MKNLELVIKENNLAEGNAKQLIQAFGAPFIEAGEIIQNYQEIVVTDESQTDTMKLAGEKRKALKRVRTGVENKRKELKSDYLKTGKAIDNVAKYIKSHIEPAEKHLELQEKYIELKAKAKAEKLKAERAKLLLEVDTNPELYNLDKIDDETFDAVLAKSKKLFELKKEHEKREAEEKRKAEEAQKAEQERLRIENEKLQAERAEILAKQEAERLARLKAEQGRLRAEQERLRVEQEKIQAQRDAEEALLKAPDAEKMKKVAEDLKAVLKSMPTLKSKEMQELSKVVTTKLKEAVDRIDTVLGEENDNNTN